MSEPTRVSNWTLAIVDLKCTACGAMNRPNVVYVEVDESGHAFCRVCSHMWIVKRS